MDDHLKAKKDSSLRDTFKSQKVMDLGFFSKRGIFAESKDYGFI
jgi:hypothetical protein